jgi:Bacterial cell division membrane protein
VLPSFDEIKKYSTTVCDQIRWKKVHPMIAKEIEDHICDQRDSYLSEGEEVETATLNAIKEMGDAVKVGMEFDKTYRPRPQWKLILLTITLMLVGAGVRYFVYEQGKGTGSFGFVSLSIAIIIFFAAYFLDFTFLGKYPEACYLIMLLMGIAGLLSSRQQNGRAYWLALPGASISLAYLSLIFPLTYALLIYAKRNKGVWGILICGAGYLPYAIVLLLVSSITGFMFYTLAALITLCTAIAKGWFGIAKNKGLMIVLLPTAIVGSAMLLLLLIQSYRMERIRILIDPSSYPGGYQLVMIREMIAGAVFAGEGTIPQQYAGALSSRWFSTDLLLTVLTHRYGWSVFLGIAILFFLFTVLAFYKVSKQRSTLGLMVSLSILIVFVLQTFLYVVDNLGYGILTGLSLPLVSFGKSALFLNAGLIGFMLSVFRNGDAMKDNIQTSVKHTPFIVYDDGKLIINLK